MRKLSIVLCVGAVAAAALPAFGVDVLTANDDVTVRGSTVYDEHQAYLEAWFGLFAKGGSDRAYVEFTLGSAPADSATLELYNYWQAGFFGNPGVDGTTTIKGAVADFNENDNSAASLDDSSWEVLGSFTMTVGSEVGFYNVDITSFYNDNLGETVTLAIRFAGSGAPGSGDGPIFDDRELTAYNAGVATTDPDGDPKIEVVPSAGCQSSVLPVGAQESTALLDLPADPDEIVYTVNNVGTVGGLGYTVAETDATGMTVLDYPWLSVDKTAGGPLEPQDTDPVLAAITTTGLEAGAYTGYLRFQDNCSSVHTHIRQINLTVIGCRWAVTPEADVGRWYILDSGTTPEPVVFTVDNTGGVAFTYTLATSGSCDWLQLDKTGGPVPVLGSDTVTGTIDPSGLGVGTYSCELEFSKDCDPQDVETRTVTLEVADSLSLQMFRADFLVLSGTDDLATSPVEDCGDGAEVDTFEVNYAGGDPPNPGWLTQGTIGIELTTAKFLHSGSYSRRRFSMRPLPFDATYDPAKGMAVAWRMKIAEYVPIRGPIQITFPSVPGPFSDELEDNSVFNAYIRLDNGTTVRILNNGGSVLSNLDPLVLADNIAGDYHRWSAGVCYNSADDMAYWNLWVEQKDELEQWVMTKLLFGGEDGTVTGPGGGTYSFRTEHDGVTGPPYIGLGELDSTAWDFEFDWVRFMSYNVSGCPLWEGTGCEPWLLWFDVDEDGDVDQYDFAAVQACYTGPSPSPGVFDPANCRRFDRDGDEDVDSSDYGKFEACATGPGVPWTSTPECP